MATRRYALVLERSNTGYSAYVPDVPGCVATGANRDEVEREIRGALAFHLEGLAMSGLSIPESISEAVEVDVPLPVEVHAQA